MTKDNAIRTFACKGCGISVTERRPPNGTKYCSLKCFRSSPRPQRKTGKEIICMQCGDKKYKENSHVGKAKFCSIECLNVFQGRNKIDFICKTCNAPFRWSPSRINTLGREPKYCSVKCRTVCPEWKRNAVVAGNLKQCNNKEPNRLEKAGAEILRNIGVEFQEQVLIENKFIVDTFIPKLKIVIQWDGDYWHGFKITNGELSQRQIKRMALDKSQDAYMRKCGYTVLRFWEHEVHGEPSKVYANIKRAIQ